MNAFLTGSRVYGNAREDSDVDLVVLVDEATEKLLHALSDGGGLPCKFGKLNLILCSNQDKFNRWARALDECKFEMALNGPLSRERAVDIHSGMMIPRCEESKRDHITPPYMG